jgi:dTDP-glucose 4,6-dehydratase
MKKVVYVTGCFGFIGSYVTRACLEKGWYVIGVDKCTYAANEELAWEWASKYTDNFMFLREDINDLKFLYECDYVINTAAETHVGNSIVKSEEFVKSNIQGVHNLLELISNYRAESNHVPTLLHFSTDEVYGDIDEGSHTEKDLLKPSNPYSATKAAADMLILAWARTYQLPYVIVRPTNNYGAGQYVEKLIPKTCKHLGLERRIPLHNGGKPVRTWLNVKDTASAIVKIIESKVVNQIYNISGGFEQTNLETVRQVIKAYNGDDLKSSTSNVEKYLDLSYKRPGMDVRYSLDDSKIRSLGWEPKAIFEEELKEIVAYHKGKFIW